MSRVTDKEKKKLAEMDARNEAKQVASKPYVAFTVRHTTGTAWQFVTLTIQDGKVINEHVKDCDDKAHAVESYRLDFVRTFIDGQ